MIVDTCGHRFEIYTLVSEIHEQVDLVLGIKNVFKLGVINSWDCCFQLPKQIPTHFYKRMCCAKTKGKKLIKVKAPIIDEISSLAIIKILHGSIHSTMLLKLKFMHNAAMLDIVNNGPDTIIFKPEEMLGILDFRSLGYYKIKQNLIKYYKIERADTQCKHFNKFINTLKRRENRKN